MLSNYLKIAWRSIVTIVLILICSLSLAHPVFAGIDDDKYDGNVFVLYAGNGSLVPARISLEDSLKVNKPSLLVFYVDDSSDCKKYSTVVDRLQSQYGKALNIMPISIDTMFAEKYAANEPGYYYAGTIPQTVVIDQEGKVVLDKKGIISYETTDNVMRQIFNLEATKQTSDFEQRNFNEFNAELYQK